MSAYRHSAVILLAGGRATRMGYLGTSIPKCLLPVCGQPFLQLLLTKLWRDGFHKVIVVVGYLGVTVRRAVDTMNCGSLDIQVVTNREGTGSALATGLGLVRSSSVALCINADTIIDIDFSYVEDEHTHFGAPITALVTERKDAPNCGAVSVSPSGYVTRFAEHSPPSAATGPDATDPDSITNQRASNCGCYALTVQPAVKLLNERRGPSLEHDFFPQAVEGKCVAALSNGERFFYDFGTLERYRRLARYDAKIRRIYDIAS